MSRTVVVLALAPLIAVVSGCAALFPINPSAPLAPMPENDAPTQALVELLGSCPGDSWSGGTEGEALDEIVCDGGFQAFNAESFFAGSEPGRFISVLSPFSTCEELLADPTWNSGNSEWVFGGGWIVESQSDDFPVDVLAEAVGGEQVNFAEWACGPNGFANDH